VYFFAPHHPAVWYNDIVIESIKGKATQNIYDGIKSKAARKVPIELHERARDLLDALNAITKIDDLKSPPSNRIHKLKGDLEGYWSISINSQWRIIFKWDGTNAHHVEITDYH
jgi:toxin HigB-1